VTSISSSDAAFPNLDTIALDNVSEVIRDGSAVLPEQVGYLHSIGIDYGNGPTSCIQYMLEHIHVYSGLPWWGTIMVTAFTLRLAMLPLFIRGADATARSMAVIPLTKPWQDKMSEAHRAGDRAGAAVYLQNIMQIRKEAGASVLRSLQPMIIQGIVGYCGFKLLHRIATLPVPELYNGGFGWITDLTLSDGYLILPALMAVTIHTVVRIGGESGSQNSLPPAMKNIMMYGIPSIMFFFLSYQPAAVTLWFATTGAFGIAQGQLLNNAAMRKRLGIAPLVKIEGSANVFADMWTAQVNKKKEEPPSFRMEDLDDHQSQPSQPSYQAPTIRTRAPSAKKRTKEEEEPAPQGSETLGDNKTQSRQTLYQMPSIKTRAPSADKVIDAKLVRKPGSPRSDSS
jgi:YidC/Oxa1 family membrane protein insertase